VVRCTSAVGRMVLAFMTEYRVSPNEKSKDLES
jgi:hypothetical protein